ncbi:MAG: YitT family protein [Clostridia bacterium]|nr:YitT family protein [Clostridia bacterium]
MKNTKLQTLKDLFVMTVATAVISCAVFFFLVPSHTSVSSVSGLAIVLSNFMPFTVSAITMVLNIVLLIIGFITCGHEFGAKTVYTSILLPVFLGILEKIFPNQQSLTGEAALDVVCYVFVVSFGLSILFNMNASSGGIDIIAKVMSRFLHMDLGKAMSFAGMVVALSSAFAYDIKTVILSVLGTYVNGLVLDHFIFENSLKRRVCIVSPHLEEIKNFILHDLHSGATIYEAIGAYRMQKRTEIITVVDKGEYQKLMSYIEKVDPQAFVTVYKVSGMRFRSKHLEERKFD